MRVRRFRRNDAASAARMIGRSLAQLNGPDYAAWVIKRLQRRYRRADLLQFARSHQVYVMVDKGRVLATAALYRQTVSMVFVDPAWVRCGLATRLMTEIEQQARRCGIPNLQLTASITARSFYQKLGYQITGQRATIQTGRLFAMTKSLFDLA